MLIIGATDDQFGAGRNDADVRRDTRAIVERNVRALFERAGGAATTALTIDRAFRELLDDARGL